MSDSGAMERSSIPAESSPSQVERQVLRPRVGAGDPRGAADISVTPRS